jgi:hypothetical protein
VVGLLVPEARHVAGRDENVELVVQPVEVDHCRDQRQ